MSTPTLEYRTIDKAAWGEGPWQSEPDKRQWHDEATGLACLIVRGPMGALCGYVGLPPGHPWHGKQYHESRVFPCTETCDPAPEGYHYGCSPDAHTDVHGGLTYSDGCEHGGNPAEGICHVPGDGDPDHVWWLGFDCGHYGDKAPGTSFHSLSSRGVYRDLAYVEAQVRALAAQLASVAS